MDGWGQAIEMFLAWGAAAGAATSTLRLRRYYLRRLAATCGRGPWDLCLDDLITFLAQPTWSGNTRKSARSAIRSFCAWAVDTDRMTTDPARRLPPVKVPPGCPKPTPQDVITRALATADRQGRLMILLALLAGLRRSEIARCHSRDITPDLLGFSLRVKGKGGKVRMVPLHQLLVAEFAGLHDGWVFPGQVDGHLSPHWVGVRLGRLLGPGWSGHTLRHRFATQAYAVEHDLFAVQQLLGHAKPETTARYTQIPQDSLRAAVRGLDSWAA